MHPALWIAKTGLQAQQNRMGVVSNNLANVSTVGFKKDRAVFEDLLYQNVRQSGAQSSQDTLLPSGLMIGTGVRTVSTEKQHTQGSLMQTEKALDMAIDGRGYFQVLRPDGNIGYTRNGDFEIDAQGQLVTPNGYLVQPGIAIPANVQSITISVDGIVSVIPAEGGLPVQVGQIQLADFINPAGLQPAGENMYLETASSGAPQLVNPTQAGAGKILQGMLEGSNVNVMEELVNMIESQRAYEVNSKAVSSADQMLSFLNNTIR
jgi:flagellar basal-body rod protein FlgG